MALGLWSVATTRWGGLPEDAWRSLDESLLAAAALALGSVAARSPAGRRAALAGALGGVTAHAVLVLARLGAGDAPRGWLDGQILDGPLGYKNAEAAALALGLPLAFWAAMRPRRRDRVLGGICAAPVLGALLLAQSRAALGCVAAAILLQVALVRSRRGLLLAFAVAAAAVLLEVRLPSVDPPAVRGYLWWVVAAAAVFGTIGLLSARSRGARLLVLAAVVGTLAAGGAAGAHSLAGVGGWLRTLGSDGEPPQGPGSTRLRSLSLNGRPQAWRVALLMAAREPLVGEGIGTYARAWARERRIDVYLLQPHSLELELLAERGAIGLVLFGAFLAALVAAIARARERGMAAAALASLTGLVLQSSVDWTWSFPGLVAIALFLVGASVGGGPGALRGRWLAPLALGTPLCLLLLALPFASDRALAHATRVERRDPGAASRSARTAASLNRWDPRVATLEGRLAETSGDFARAAARYEDARRLSARPWVQTFLVARALRRAGRVAASRAACVDAVRENPGEPLLLGGPCAYDAGGNPWPLRSLSGPRGAYEALRADLDCGGCRVRVRGDDVLASVAAAVDTRDTAYAVRGLGGPGGSAGPVAVSASLALVGRSRLADNLAVLEVRDVRDALLYQVYVAAADTTIRVYSPPGGPVAGGLNVSTGSRLGRGRRVQVTADAGDLLVRVDGRLRVHVALDPARASRQRFLRVGIVGYAGWSTRDPVRVALRDVTVGGAPPRGGA